MRRQSVYTKYEARYLNVNIIIIRANARADCLDARQVTRYGNNKRG